MRETMTAFKGMMNTIRKQVHDNSKRILTIERKYKESQGRLEDDIVKTMDPKVLALDRRLEAVLNTTNENTEVVLSNKNESSQMLGMVNSISLRVGSVENRTVSLAQEQEDLRANSPCGACRAALTEEIVSTVMSRLQEAREWPTGTYGLPRTNTGCPEAAGVTWRTGVRKHDTEDDDASNQWTHGLHFDGGFWRGDMLQKFCMKTISSDGSGSWPSGSYCIFKKSSCPPGFQSGELFWDDEDDDNGNYRSGVLPDGIYNGNTLIRYCCRNDGSASSPISLPTGSPFYLFRYRQGCQRVDDMNVREEFFRWDDEDDDNKNRRQGAYPYDDGGSRDHRLHYCYYS
ncbi:uncharacterized protein LOC144919349 [Branchiostoma floridae x Branchiostoma belcheri]